MKSPPLSFEDVVLAYFQCRKNKRNSHYALEFEINLERNLYDLYLELKSGEYEIGRSIAFVVEQPKIREIWSATFRDRVVHHVIYNRLFPRFYPRFIENTFACIPGRGTLRASDRLLSGIRSITANGREKSYFLGADVRNFFVSIHKPTLMALLEKKISEGWLRQLVKQVLFHDPRKNCTLKSKSAAFARVPGHKSLWKTPGDRGLPIGNLTSQFFANVYLNELDQFVKHKLRASYYYRYVDDVVILDPSPSYLNHCFAEMDSFLEQNLKLILHPYKKRLGLVNQGVDFVGYVHFPYYRLARVRTIHKVNSLVHQWKKNPNGFEQKNLEKLRASYNAYMGVIRWGKTYKVRKNLGDRVNCLFARPDRDYTKIILNAGSSS